ncbi:amino acid adenylation domain-containing protein [Streptomyces sp. NPDC051561]|uniref:amino acid adenylation domain-containing protein n=1 Tax=Streptomyces sp. NPDC051561 TaxID=3365658 RepID=UPI0037B2C15B
MPTSTRTQESPPPARSSLEAVLPLTPLQEGMLFHALYDDEAIDVYAIQVAFALDGPLSADALRAAADALLGRHAALRAGFQLRKSGLPVQLVRRDVRVPWSELDLRGLQPDEQQRRLNRYRAADRAKGFDMARPPLIRLTLVRLADRRQVLVMTYHHILLDAWSFQIVLDDLFTLYTQDADPAGLVRVVPFEGYLAWLAAQDRQAAQDAWAAALDGLEEGTLIAAGRPARGPATLPRLASTELSPELTADLTEAVRAAGLTLNTVLQGIWALTLSGLTGRQDVVFGQTVSGRPAELDGVEGMVGLFINAAPVRVRLDPAEPLAALLARVQREQAALEPFHHLGLAEIQRGAGLGDLYDTAVAFASAPLDWDAVPTYRDLRVTLAEDTAEEQPEGWTHYPLNLSAQPGRTLRLALSYDGDLFEGPAADRLMTRLRMLLSTYLDAPRTPVGRIELFTEEEWAQAVHQGNDTRRPVPDTTLPALFAAQAARTPEATALVFEDRSLSYGAFARRVAELADALRARGVGGGDFVAVAVPRSVELVVALHAVLAAGAAYVPVDPEYPAQRIGWILEDSAPRLLLTTSAVAALLPPCPVPQLFLDRPLPSDAPVAPVREPVGADPAYVIFTSGSTGRPKGVVVPHSAIVNRLVWMQDRYPLEPGDRVLQKTPSGFDVSVWEFFWPLQTGAALVVAAPGGHKDAAYLAALIRRESVTVAHFVPSMLQVFLQEPTADDCTSLRQVFSSGEALSAETQNRFFERLGASLHNLYGPTEAAVDVTHWDCRPDEENAANTAVPIGRPVWNTQVYVLDPALRPVASGVPGELYLAGHQLASGYVDRPGLTAERFVANPFAPEGKRMYRTGDVVRRTPGGDLEYLGRADDQVKIRGLRVELGEIEAVLARHEAVAQVAVVVREDQPGVQRLVAYTVSAGPPAEPQQLLDLAAAALPDYMVPAALVQVAELPLTPNGKLDRKALPAPALVRAVGGRAAHGAVEQQLAELFAAVLGVPEVGAEDSFFDLGGDSIVSIQLVARARRAGLALTPKDVFTHRTVAALARVARPARDAVQEAPGAGVGEVPATPITHWLSEHRGPSDGFHQATLLQVPPLARTDLLTASVQAVLDRHDALRMRRTARDAGPTWELDIAPAAAVRAEDCVRRVGVEGLDADALRARITTESARAVAELAPDERRMVRFVWFDAGPRDAGRLLVVAHHLVVDGVSWRILLPDLRAAWEAVESGGTPGLAPVPTSLRTWAHRLSEAATDPARIAELPLWEGVLRAGDDPALAARPLDHTCDVHGTARSLTLRLAAEHTEPLLTTVPAAYRAGVDDVLLTALALAVGSWRRERGLGEGTGVLVDLEGHGREEIAAGLDLSRTVGWFTSLYPVRLDPGVRDWEQADGTGHLLGTALKRVKEQLRAIPDHGIGYGMLRRLNPETAAVLGALPVPQLGFNYLGRFAGSDGGHWQPAAESDATGPAADAGLSLPHVLDINAVTEDLPAGPQLVASFTWPGALLAEDDVRRLGEAWLAALRALVADTSREGSGGLTPTDVRPAVVGQRELELLESAWAERGLQDVLPLTPVQEGLLFHACYDRQAPDVYNVQLVIELAGELRTEGLRAACQALTDRHPALRAVFTQTASGTPVQLIPGSVPAPWHEHDLRDGGPTGDGRARERLDAFLTEDRIRRFDPSRAPLLRFTLLRLGEERHALVFTSHHLLADGWSVSLMLRDLFALWSPDARDVGRTPPVPVRRYYEWLAAQDTAAAQRAWRAALDGLTGPTLLAAAADTGSLPSLPLSAGVELPEDLTAEVAARARSCGLTLNTVVQGAWALALHHLTGRRDVVFGATVSVRPPELPGVEEMVGLLISTVPVRVRLDPAETLAALLDRVQTEQVALAPHAHLGPAAVQRVAGLGPLYDTSMVFENFPRTADHPELPGTGLRIAGFSGRDAYHYPLKLMAVPGDRLYLEVSHRAELVTAAQAEEALGHLRTLLTEFAADPSVRVGGLLQPVPEPVVPVAAGPTSPVPVTPGDHRSVAALCALAGAVLGGPVLSAEADFFALGGDSLRALRLAGRMREAFGAPVDVSVVFRGRTAAGMAAVLARQGTGISEVRHS